MTNLYAGLMHVQNVARWAGHSWGGVPLPKTIDIDEDYIGNYVMGNAPYGSGWKDIVSPTIRGNCGTMTIKEEFWSVANVTYMESLDHFRVYVTSRGDYMRAKIIVDREGKIPRLAPHLGQLPSRPIDLARVLVVTARLLYGEHPPVDYPAMCRDLWERIPQDYKDSVMYAGVEPDWNLVDTCWHSVSKLLVEQNTASDISELLDDALRIAQATANTEAIFSPLLELSEHDIKRLLVACKLACNDTIAV